MPPEDHASDPLQESRDARSTLNGVLLATLAVCLAILAMGSFNRDSVSLLLASAVVVAGLALNRWNRPELAAATSLVLLLCLVGEVAFRARDGMRSIITVMFPTLLLLAALLIRLRWFVAYAIAILAIVAAVGAHDIQRFAGRTPPPRSPTTARTVVTVELVLALGATVAGLLIQNLQRGLKRSREASARLKEANEALQTSESMFRTLVELAADAIFIATPAGVVLSANQESCALTGFTIAELSGRPIVGLFSGDPRSGKPLALDCFRQEGSGPFNAAIHCKDGSTRPVELNSTLMPGHVIQIICRDITDRLQAEERIQQLQKLESLGLLAGGVAHDFNNLLTVINGFAELALMRLPPSDPLRVQIEQIHKAGVRGASLTAQLLAFGRKQLLRPEPARINRLIEENLEMLRRLMGEDISLSADLAPDAGLILADAGLFHQILINLAANARDAMPGGGRLVISTGCVESCEPSLKNGPEARLRRGVRLTVADTGTGMTEEVRRRVFEPFFTTKEEGRGTGLGLATVYGIVQQMGGTVSVESQPGAGTTFQFLFPQAEFEEPAVADHEHPAGITPGGETILLVEDNAGVRAFAREVLEGLGYGILEAEDAPAALDLLAKQAGPVHLLLTDVVLPGMNGRDLASLVLQMMPQVKVLLMSGYSEDDLNTPGSLEEGITCLPKPFSPAGLATKVREILNGRD